LVVVVLGVGQVEELFTDVFDTIPKHLQEQKAELEVMMHKYPEHYTTASH
jgi:2-oxoisovalerate dehydrogenase E1 component alpha subunit